MWRKKKIITRILFSLLIFAIRHFRENPQCTHSECNTLNFYNCRIFFFFLNIVAYDLEKKAGIGHRGITFQTASLFIYKT